MNKIRLLFFGFILAFLTAASIPETKGIGPENVAVIVNGDSWSSKTIANEFIRLRSIPSENVVQLDGIESFESIGVDDFRSKILSPLLKILDERGIRGQIDCIAYSSDFPTAINASSDMQGKTLPPTLAPIASINGLTYLYSMVMSKNAAYIDLNSNLYARRILKRSADTQWSPEERNEYAKTSELMKTPPPGGTDAAKEESMKKLNEALAILDRLAQVHPCSEGLLYNLACCQAKLGKKAEALDSMEKSNLNGWFDWSYTEKDEDLKSLREAPEFKSIIEKMKNCKMAPSPTTGFKADVGWAMDGSPVPAIKGIPYILSIMLACTSGRGMSVRESVEYLRIAAGADFSHPKGTIYFEKNGDVRSTAREWAFTSVSEKLKSSGINAIVEDGVLPQNRNDVVGAVVGSAGFDWKKSGSKILPGAICEHLTSFGGVMGEGSGQTCLTEFLVNGAAGASGTVTEPYAIQEKFPSPYIQLHYTEGVSLVEAFYLSVAGPYQLLIIGDPLCRPWGRKIDLSIMGVKSGEKLSGMVKISPLAQCPKGLEIVMHQLFIDGKRIMQAVAREGFNLDTSKIPDGFHHLQVVSIADDRFISQGRISLPIEIRNGKRNMKTKLVGGNSHRWDSPIEIDLESSGAKEIVVKYNSATVARIEGGKGRASIAPELLGSGPVSLKPVAFFNSDNDMEFHGKPIELQIVSPDAISALNMQQVREMENGFIVHPKDKPLAIIGKFDKESIEKAGISNGVDFTIESFFTADKEDVYQFQFNASVKIKSLKIDGRKIKWPSREGATWWMIPVALCAGIHKVEIECTAISATGIDIRFGSPGSKRLDGQQFKHNRRQTGKIGTPSTSSPS